MIEITNKSGRSLGYAAGAKGDDPVVHVVEAGETKRLPLKADDPRVRADLHVGAITINHTAESASGGKLSAKTA